MTKSATSVWVSWSLLLESTPRVLYFRQPRTSASRHSHNKSRIPVSVSRESEIPFDISIAETNIQTSTRRSNLILGYLFNSFFTLINWCLSQDSITKSIPSKRLFYIKFKCIGNLKRPQSYRDSHLETQHSSWKVNEVCGKDHNTPAERNSDPGLCISTRPSPRPLPHLQQPASWKLQGPFPRACAPAHSLGLQGVGEWTEIK